MAFLPAMINDETGEVLMDSDTLEGSDESGAVRFPFGKGAMSRRLARLERRSGKLRGRLGIEDEESASVGDAYGAAVNAGAIVENQINGLGFVSIPLSGTGTLQDQVNRTCWIKSIVLTSASPTDILVTGITVAGLPYNIGAQGTPMVLFNHDSTRFAVDMTKRLVTVGQTVAVQLRNLNAGAAVVVAGGFVADEMNPYTMQHFTEAAILGNFSKA